MLELDIPEIGVQGNEIICDSANEQPASCLVQQGPAARAEVRM